MSGAAAAAATPLGAGSFPVAASPSGRRRRDGGRELQRERGPGGAEAAGAGEEAGEAERAAPESLGGRAGRRLPRAREPGPSRRVHSLLRRGVPAGLPLGPPRQGGRRGRLGPEADERRGPAGRRLPAGGGRERLAGRGGAAAARGAGAPVRLGGGGGELAVFITKEETYTNAEIG